MKKAVAFQILQCTSAWFHCWFGRNWGFLWSRIVFTTISNDSQIVAPQL